MENITVIIPIHVYNEDVKKYLGKAIESIKAQTEAVDSTMIVGQEELINKIKDDFNDAQIDYIINEGKTDYCNQINLAANNCKTKHFSILGFDDEYSPIWFKNVKRYIKNMHDISIFLPIVNFIDKESKVIGSVNEIIWAMSFSNELGFIDEETLESYYDFSTCGGVFRTDDFIFSGGLKPSIKLSFWYEFLLRSANQGFKTYVIPKNGYYHLIDREGSILNSYNSMTKDERAWWIKLANKEHYFKNERKESYEYKPTKELSDIDGLK